MRTLIGSLAAAVLLVATLATPTLAAAPGDPGVDAFGYNETARVFVGAADGVDRNLDGTVWGNPTYANDRLVMKWNAAWDACNDHGYDDATYCAGAWTTNHWNGAVPGGSGEVWQYKIIWVGSAGAASPYWVEGGYSVWGNYEVVMDQGVVDGVHVWYARGIPNGLGTGQ